MKNKILTSILISCITLAVATTQPCYAAEEQHVSEHSEEHARTAEDPDHHAEPAPEETASIQEGQGNSVTAVGIRRRQYIRKLCII